MKIFYAICCLTAVLNSSSQHYPVWIREVNTDSLFQQKDNIYLQRDGNSNLYVGAMGKQPSGKFNSLLNKYDLNGNLICQEWLSNYWMTDIQLYQSNLFSFGQTLIKRSPLCNQTNQVNSMFYKGVLNNSSLYYIGYYGEFIKSDQNGNSLWQKMIENSENVQIKCAANHLYILCHIFSQDYYGTRIYKFDTLGNEIWHLNVPPTNNLSVDGSGTCYLTSAEFISKIASTGTLLWSTPVPGLSLYDAVVVGDTLLACGNAHVNGTGTLDDFKGLLLTVSPFDGTIYHTEFFDFFHSPHPYAHNNTDEAITTLLSLADGLYVGGWFCSYSPQPFLVKLTTNPPTGISKTENSNTLLQIFPNPINQHLTLIGNFSTQPSKLLLRNSLGQVVLEKEINNCIGEYSETVDVSALPKGVYVLQLKSGTIVETKKVVIGQN